MPDLIGELKPEEIGDELYYDLPHDNALNQYATRHRRQFAGALNVQKVGLIKVPEELATKNGKQ